MSFSCHTNTHVFHQLLEAETMRHIFMNNYQLCNEISDRVVHHFVHCIETHGRHVQYLKFLETIVKADGKYVKKSQDKVMTEVRMTFSRHLNPHDGSPASTSTHNLHSLEYVYYLLAGAVCCIKLHFIQES